MRALALVCLVLIGFPLTAGAEQLYKWRDARGTVNYGDDPPKGVDAVRVDTRPNLAQGIGSSDCVGPGCRRAAIEPNPLRRDDRAEEPGRQLAGRAPRGLDFDVYIRLKAGMSEGELLQRAGPPDFESVESFRGPILKSFYYYPTSSNPYTTVVSLRGGRIFTIERVKKF